MKLSKTLVLTLTLAFPVFFSEILTAQNNPLSYIPDDAQNIYVLNMPSIVKKMDLNAIKDMDFFKNMLQEAENKPDSKVELLKNPTETGIDFNKQFVISISQLDNTTRKLMTFIVPLSDKAKFEKLIGSMPNVNIQKADNYNFLETDSTLTVWNSNVVVYKVVGKEKMPKFPRNTEGGDINPNQDDQMVVEDPAQQDAVPMDEDTDTVVPDSTLTEESDIMLDSTMVDTGIDSSFVVEDDVVKEPETVSDSDVPPPPPPAETESLKAFLPKAEDVLKLSDNNRIKAVNSILDKPHDIYIYQTSDGVTKNPLVNLASMFLGFEKEEFEGNNTYGWCDFENGRIYGESKQVLNEKLKQKMASIVNTKPAVDWNNYIKLDGVNQPMMVLSMSVNPSGLIKTFGENPFLKGGLDKAAQKSKKKVDFKEVMDHLGGDIFATFGIVGGGLNFIVGLNVKDSKWVSKWLEKEMNAKEITKNMYALGNKEGSEKAKMLNEKSFALLRDNILFIGNETRIRELAETPSVKKQVKPTEALQPWQKSLQNKTFNMFMDFGALMSMAPRKSDTDGAFMDSMPMESMRLTMGEGLSEFELKMKNADKNSLYSFIDWINNISNMRKNKEKTVKD